MRKAYEVGSEDRDGVVFTGQRVRWDGDVLKVDQNKAIEELTEIPLGRGAEDDQRCDA